MRSIPSVVVLFGLAMAYSAPVGQSATASETVGLHVWVDSGELLTSPYIYAFEGAFELLNAIYEDSGIPLQFVPIWEGVTSATYSSDIGQYVDNFAADESGIGGLGIGMLLTAYDFSGVQGSGQCPGHYNVVVADVGSMFELEWTEILGKTMAHEIGHNFRASHGGSHSCGGPSGQSDETRLCTDPLDVCYDVMWGESIQNSHRLPVFSNGGGHNKDTTKNNALVITAEAIARGGAI